MSNFAIFFSKGLPSAMRFADKNKSIAFTASSRVNAEFGDHFNFTIFPAFALYFKKTQPASKLSTCSNLGAPSMGPKRVTASAPAALANLPMRSSFQPACRPAIKAAEKQSPAPVGSTSST
jgi:hypothetical protein